MMMIFLLTVSGLFDLLKHKIIKSKNGALMNPISFMTANFVGREVNYHMTDWGHGQNAVEAYFRPIDTYAERMGVMLDEVCQMGFEYIDLWLAHLGPAWATEDHISIAKTALKTRGLRVSSLAGGFSDNPVVLERCCQLAKAMDTRILGGMAGLLSKDRASAVRILQEYNAILAIENHPEKTPLEVLAQIGDGGGGTVATCVDTGIWAIHGYDAAKAIEELQPYVVHVHLKDILKVGEHDSCRYGRGVVPLKRCVDLLLENGYQGGFSVEHEPQDYDPSPDVKASFGMLKEWLGLQ
jgi:L-ribulose-5-phosphate 3-epimerase